MSLKDTLDVIGNLSIKKNKKIYLVGGFLRDIYLGQPGRDLDFAVSGNAMNLAQEVAEVLKGVYIPLDRINRVARVVLEPRGSKWQIDFSSFKGLSIEEDLSNRDFTINAMALELDAYLKLSQENGTLSGKRPDRRRWPEFLTDPYSGLADIEGKTIRAINSYVFEADPVRILRAVRLSGKLGFKIDPETLSLMEQNRWLLQEVAGERIWEELLGILSLPQSYPLITVLDDTGILSEVFPVKENMSVSGQNLPTDNVWAHSLKTYKLLEELCGRLTGIGTGDRAAEIRGLLRKHLDQGLTSERKRSQLIKLAALFHDPGNIEVYISEFARRLKMSKVEESYLKNLAGKHTLPVSLFNKPARGPADFHRFFIGIGQDTPDVLLLSLANMSATPDLKSAFDLAGYRSFIVDLLYKYYFEAEKYINPPILVKGEDLMTELGLRPSRQLGDLLEKITEAQVCGEVTSRREAITYAARLLKENEG
ncbi:CCA tRNA nucleotidyltransferase [Pelotomaculum propionicicum]|uniref:Multifunctional CCA protein n=1 Tax=Pelotomaculum propionicicum TaxID=258475 RepID=A0A4Y7RNX7_9FIRM|nr:CCA tRNA nucleotidyltransferase [Pelotomaculum propionicicum]NLI12321.1 CCA tRNA nucleotidyltransferase [Peptococcaceae bacterium]TEB10450.1 Multifunctional CCA protein [Pelotomaculum propionicicum]